MFGILEGTYCQNSIFHNLTYSYFLQGNDHVIYNGTFFYLHYESESIVRYDLTSRQVTKKNIPRNRIVRDSGGPLLSKLYLPQFDDNYLDLMTDENGLWGVFGLAVDNNTVVMKFDDQTLEMQFMWNISLAHHQGLSHLLY